MKVFYVILMTAPNWDLRLVPTKGHYSDDDSVGSVQMIYYLHNFAILKTYRVGTIFRGIKTCMHDSQAPTHS